MIRRATLRHAALSAFTLLTLAAAAPLPVQAQAKPAAPQPPPPPPPARPPQRPPAPPPAAPDISVRGFGEFGGTLFTASDSFEAVLGSASGVVFGGGAEVVLRQGWFFGGRVARFAKDGHRVFVSGDEVFDLGIDTTVTITPIEFTGGYRFHAPRRRLIPYIGGGVGAYSYSEESAFAAGDDDVSESHVSYHLLGGAEYRLNRWLGIAGEAQWTTVPDGIGQDPNSVGTAFDETDLGGTTFRVKVVFGR